MRTIEIYTFEELGPEATTVAIDEVKAAMEENDQQEAYHWAIDDCALFEPKQEEMVNLFGAEYTDKFSDKGFLFKNKRKGINFNNEYFATLDIREALEIQDDSMFKTWLEIPTKYHNFLGYEFYEYCDNTRLSFTVNDDIDSSKNDEILKIFELGEEKFKSHISDIASRIESSIEEYFSVESIIEKISDNKEYEFTADGRRYTT
jgi:hypothetical protein